MSVDRTVTLAVQAGVARITLNRPDKLNSFTRVMHAQLAEAIVSGGTEDPLKSHRREITVVFLDLRGFTANSMLLDNSTLVQWLNAYYACIVPAVEQHGGVGVVHGNHLREIDDGDAVVVIHEHVELIEVAVHEAAARKADHDVHDTCEHLNKCYDNTLKEG
jgi:class 3 adenylate cyclase